jgi:tRNA nucleotidyltransferase (CCA-adding enzyme)
MEIGTPKEDAARRDLTINALFYNVNTNYIEDYTGTGLKDLEEKIVRTPLAAFKTLEDDPLRALRAIRFACRFNFKMEEDLVKSCADPRVHEALKNKVSYERINTEFDAMMIHPLASKAIVMLYEMGLIKLVFPLPSIDQIQVKSDTKRSHNIDSLNVFHSYGVALNLLADILKREQSFVKGITITI